MDVFIDPESHVGLADQIYAAIRDGIVDGRIAPGDQVPPSRELADTLGVSRHTVTTAYGRLTAEGYLDGRRGGGTVVSDLSGLGTWTERVVDPPVTTGRYAGIGYDLRPGTPDPRLFPATEWKRHLRRAVDGHTGAYGEPAGLVELRLALARWIARSRGVEARFRDLTVTSGAQQALYLLARTCLAPGDVVAMENPGYHRVRDLLASAGVRVVPVDVDRDGIVVEAIPPSARLVYVTPSHQFPTGVTLSMSRRVALLAFAERHGAVIVEDDYDSEFRYVDRPLEPLYRLDRIGCVAYVASFSKILSPALRLGFMVVPPDFLPGVLGLRELIDWSSPSIDQLALAGFIAAGDLDRHLRRARRTYQERHDLVATFLAGLDDVGILEAQTSNAGLHISARLPAHVDAAAEADLVARLAERGVALNGYGPYLAGAMPAQHGLVLGFGLVDVAGISEALRTTGEVLRMARADATQH